LPSRRIFPVLSPLPNLAPPQTALFCRRVWKTIPPFPSHGSFEPDEIFFFAFLYFRGRSPSVNPGISAIRPFPLLILSEVPVLSSVMEVYKNRQPFSCPPPLPPDIVHPAQASFFQPPPNIFFPSGSWPTMCQPQASSISRCAPASCNCNRESLFPPSGPDFLSFSASLSFFISPVPSRSPPLPFSFFYDPLIPP